MKFELTEHEVGCLTTLIGFVLCTFIIMFTVTKCENDVARIKMEQVEKK